MKTMIKSLALALLAGCGVALTSCEDMLTKESEYYLYADKDHLSTASDTVNSVLGIVNKLQNIAVRTNLLGEVRADLVELDWDVADVNLQQLANNDIADDNKYNSPRDYYAIINNCNYFLAHADSTLTNVARDTIFRKEIDAVRVYRAWTYLQLAINYGRVPLVTEPILSSAQAEEWEAKPQVDLLGVCDYFINDLAMNYKSDEFPSYGKIDDTRLNQFIIFFPRLVVLGDLYLWRNALTGNVEDAKQAALCYYRWIANTKVGGRSKFLYSAANTLSWAASCFTTGSYERTSSSSSSYWGSVGAYGNENITVIPMDSASNQANYNQLRVLYNSRKDNNYKPSLLPSTALQELSKAQVYCGYDESQHLAIYPSVEDITSGYYGNRNPMYVGDLRYVNNVTKSNMRVQGEMLDYQTIEKQYYGDILIYRASMVYLRMAEALNAAGYPAFASTILTWGLSNYSIEEEVLPYCTTAADSGYVKTFTFPNTECIVFGQSGNTTSYTQVGIHSHGSGNTHFNERYHKQFGNRPVKVPYVMPQEVLDSLEALELKAKDLKAKVDSITHAEDSIVDAKYAAVLHEYFSDGDVVFAEQCIVDSLLQVEWALEECFEGTRFYNLMRADYRYRNQHYTDNGGTNHGFGWTEFPLSQAVSRRDAVVGEKLKDVRNWFLKWQGKIGL